MAARRKQKASRAKANFPDDSCFTRKELSLFLIVFAATFTVVSAMSLIFQPVRVALHDSAALSKMMFASSVTGEAHQENIFTDVPANYPNAAAIAYLKKKGIVSGYEDGSFKPDGKLNRAELMKLIGGALQVDPHALTNSNCFNDVKEEWFAPYVCYAKNKGWVSGFGDGGFHPNANVTKAEALKMILASVGTKLTNDVPAVQFTDVHAGDWFAPYVWTAQEKNWLEEKADVGPYGPNSEITRAQVAEVLFRVVSVEVPSI